MTYVLNASARLLAFNLLASKADEAQAKILLQELGFKGLVLKLSSEDRISFKYATADTKFLDKHLGKSKQIGPTSIYWKFGADGTIVVKSGSKVVVLKNSVRNSKAVKELETKIEHEVHKPVPAPLPKAAPPPVHTPQLEAPKEPIETHVPVHTPQTPNTPGSKENDDDKVPHVAISDTLVKQYGWAQNSDNGTYRIQFLTHLWHFLNTNKFHGDLDVPQFRLLKNMGATSMRLRGRWWPRQHLLEIAPRLFNAHIAFFVEVVLHEMCHQAVTEIDKADWDNSEKGHGPHWKAWMRKVGLNPNRFDPQDNSTYMTPEELGDHEAKKREQEVKKKILQNEITDRKLVRVWRLEEKMPATVKWNNQVYDGLIICPVNKAGSKWAFIKEGGQNSTQHMIISINDVYKYDGADESKFEQPVWQAIADRTIRYYLQKLAPKRRF